MIAEILSSTAAKKEEQISNCEKYFWTLISLIDSLDRLIVKKKSIKQGAMQELLTGKKRLPGFQEGLVNQETW